MAGSQGGAVIKLKALVLAVSDAFSEQLASILVGRPTRVSSAQQRSPLTSKHESRYVGDFAVLLLIGRVLVRMYLYVV